MKTGKIKQIITDNKNDIAFLVGNGINRYSDEKEQSSWKCLLRKLCCEVCSEPSPRIPDGISMTEYYNILELRNTQNEKVNKKVAEFMADCEPKDHHSKITKRIKELNAPILTTNFDNNLAKTFEYKVFRTEQKGFTDYYPWTTYHGESQLSLPTDGFGVWYINGMINYHRSIRLGLSQYMGSVVRARNLLHRGNEGRLFSDNKINDWSGAKTWLHIFFNKSLFIFGLGLEENETFLRWLLIERKKYFQCFPEREHKGWYIKMKNEETAKDKGKNFFLEQIGFKIIEVDKYEDIYENIWK